MVWNLQWVAECVAEAVPKIQDSTFGPEGGDKSGLYVVEGGRVGDVGRGGVSQGCCHEGISGAKGATMAFLCEDVFFPEEGQGCIGDGWEVGG